jgi:hypothetical protein
MFFEAGFHLLRKAEHAGPKLRVGACVIIVDIFTIATFITMKFIEIFPALSCFWCFA